MNSTKSARRRSRAELSLSSFWMLCPAVLVLIIFGPATATAVPTGGDSPWDVFSLFSKNNPDFDFESTFSEQQWDMKKGGSLTPTIDLQLATISVAIGVSIESDPETLTPPAAFNSTTFGEQIKSVIRSAGSIEVSVTVSGPVSVTTLTNPFGVTSTDDRNSYFTVTVAIPFVSSASSSSLVGIIKAHVLSADAVHSFKSTVDGGYVLTDISALFPSQTELNHRFTSNVPVLPLKAFPESKVVEGEEVGMEADTVESDNARVILIIVAVITSIILLFCLGWTVMTVFDLKLPLSCCRDNIGGVQVFDTSMAHACVYSLAAISALALALFAAHYLDVIRDKPTHHVMLSHYLSQRCGNSTINPLMFRLSEVKADGVCRPVEVIGGESMSDAPIFIKALCSDADDVAAGGASVYSGTISITASFDQKECESAAFKKVAAGDCMAEVPGLFSSSTNAFASTFFAAAKCYRASQSQDFRSLMRDLYTKPVNEAKSTDSQEIDLSDRFYYQEPNVPGLGTRFVLGGEQHILTSTPSVDGTDRSFAALPADFDNSTAQNKLRLEPFLYRDGGSATAEEETIYDLDTDRANLLKKGFVFGDEFEHRHHTHYAIDSLRYAGAARSSVDFFAGESQSCTITTWVKFSRNTTGFVFALVDNWESDAVVGETKISYSPIISRVMDMIGSGHDYFGSNENDAQQSFNGSPWRMYLGLYVNGMNNTARLVSVNPKNANDDDEDGDSNNNGSELHQWTFGEKDLRLFDNQWHMLTLTLGEDDGGEYISRIFIDGRTSFTKGSWKVCIKKKYLSSVQELPSQVLIRDTATERVKQGGVLHIGHISTGSIFNFRVHDGVLQQQQILVLGATSMKLNDKVDIGGSLLLGYILAACAAVMALASGFTLVVGIHGSRRDRFVFLMLKHISCINPILKTVEREKNAAAALHEKLCEEAKAIQSVVGSLEGIPESEVLALEVENEKLSFVDPLADQKEKLLNSFVVKKVKPVREDVLSLIEEHEHLSRKNDKLMHYIHSMRDVIQTTLEASPKDEDEDSAADALTRAMQRASAGTVAAQVASSVASEVYTRIIKSGKLGGGANTKVDLGPVTGGVSISTTAAKFTDGMFQQIYTLIIPFFTVCQALALYVEGWTWPEEFRVNVSWMLGWISFDINLNFPFLPDIVNPAIQAILAVAFLIGAISLLSRDGNLFDSCMDTETIKAPTGVAPELGLSMIVTLEENDTGKSSKIRDLTKGPQKGEQETPVVEDSTSPQPVENVLACPEEAQHLKQAAEIPQIVSTTDPSDQMAQDSPKDDKECRVPQHNVSDLLAIITGPDDQAPLKVPITMKISVDDDEPYTFTDVDRRTSGRDVPMRVSLAVAKGNEIIKAPLLCRINHDHARCPEHDVLLISAVPHVHHVLYQRDESLYECAFGTSKAEVFLKMQKPPANYCPGVSGEFFVCPNDDCRYTVCGSCNDGFVNKLKGRLGSQWYNLKRYGVPPIIGMLLVMGVQSIQQPVVKTSLMIMICHSSFQCLFPSCYDDPSVTFLTVVVMSAIICFLVGVVLTVYFFYLVIKRVGRIREEVNRVASAENISNMQALEKVFTMDHTLLKALYHQYDFGWLWLNPVTMIFKLACVMPIIFAEPNSLSQLAAISVIEAFQAFFWVGINPFTDPWVAFLTNVGGAHQLAQLSLSAFTRVAVYEDRNTSIYSYIMLVVFALYCSVMLVAIVMVVVVPLVSSLLSPNIISGAHARLGKWTPTAACISNLYMSISGATCAEIRSAITNPDVVKSISKMKKNDILFKNINEHIEKDAIDGGFLLNVQNEVVIIEAVIQKGETLASRWWSSSDREKRKSTLNEVNISLVALERMLWQECDILFCILQTIDSDDAIMFLKKRAMFHTHILNNPESSGGAASSSSRTAALEGTEDAANCQTKHAVGSLHRACRFGLFESFLAICERGLDTFSDVDSAGNNCLHWAADHSPSFVWRVAKSMFTQKLELFTMNEFDDTPWSGANANYDMSEVKAEVFGMMSRIYVFVRLGGNLNDVDEYEDLTPELDLLLLKLENHQKYCKLLPEYYLLESVEDYNKMCENPPVLEHYQRVIGGYGMSEFLRLGRMYVGDALMSPAMLIAACERDQVAIVEACLEADVERFLVIREEDRARTPLPMAVCIVNNSFKCAEILLRKYAAIGKDFQQGCKLFFSSNDPQSTRYVFGDHGSEGGEGKSMYVLIAESGNAAFVTLLSKYLSVPWAGRVAIPAEDEKTTTNHNSNAFAFASAPLEPREALGRRAFSAAVCPLIANLHYVSRKRREICCGQKDNNGVDIRRLEHQWHALTKAIAEDKYGRKMCSDEVLLSAIIEEKDFAAFKAFLDAYPPDTDDGSFGEKLAECKKDEMVCYAVKHLMWPSSLRDVIELNSAPAFTFLLRTANPPVDLSAAFAAANDSKLFFTPLQYAVAHSCAIVVKCLLQQPSVSVDETGPQGVSPLIMALRCLDPSSMVTKDSLSVAAGLIEENERLSHTTPSTRTSDDEKDTVDRAECMAQKKACADRCNIVSLLISNKAKIPPEWHHFSGGESVNSPTSNTNRLQARARSLLCLAFYYRNAHLVEQIVVREDTEANAVDVHGNSALHFAAKEGLVQLSQVVLRRKNVNINLVNKEGDTPLMVAVNNMKPRVAQILVRAGCDTSGLGPNHWAIINENKNMKDVELTLRYLKEGLKRQEGTKEDRAGQKCQPSEGRRNVIDVHILVKNEESLVKLRVIDLHTPVKNEESLVKPHAGDYTCSVSISHHHHLTSQEMQQKPCVCDTCSGKDDPNAVPTSDNDMNPPAFCNCHAEANAYRPV